MCRWMDGNNCHFPPLPKTRYFSHNLHPNYTTPHPKKKKFLRDFPPSQPPFTFTACNWEHPYRLPCISHPRSQGGINMSGEHCLLSELYLVLQAAAPSLLFYREWSSLSMAACRKQAATRNAPSGNSLPRFVEAEPLDGRIKGESMLGMSRLLFLLAYPHKKNKGRGRGGGQKLGNKLKKILFGCKKKQQTEDSWWQSCVLKRCKFKSWRASLQRRFSASCEDRQMQVPE